MFNSYISSFQLSTSGQYVNKNRRPSNTPEDMFYAFISGMDAFALGLIKAAAYAAELKKPASPGSGRQEYVETVLNNILFS